MTVSAKDTNHGLANYTMVFMILCLYGLYTLGVAFDWSFYCWVFIDNGWSFWTVLLASESMTPEFLRREWVLSISSVISTFAVDTSLVRQFLITH